MTLTLLGQFGTTLYLGMIRFVQRPEFSDEAVGHIREIIQCGFLPRVLAFGAVIAGALLTQIAACATGSRGLDDSLLKGASLLGIASGETTFGFSTSASIRIWAGIVLSLSVGLLSLEIMPGPPLIAH